MLRDVVSALVRPDISCKILPFQANDWVWNVTVVFRRPALAGCFFSREGDYGNDHFVHLSSLWSIH